MFKAGITKPYVRDKVYTYFNDCNNIFTLPNLNFSLEKKFMNDGKIVECAERNSKIFYKQFDIKPENLFIYNNDIKDIDLTNYDGLFLDMCGSFSLAVGETLITLKQNTKVVLTLLFARETALFQRCFPQFDILNRVDSYITILNSYGYVVDYSVEYADNKSPMGVFFCRKITF